MDEWEWLDALTDALGEPRVTRQEIGQMLKLGPSSGAGIGSAWLV